MVGSRGEWKGERRDSGRNVVKIQGMYVHLYGKELNINIKNKQKIRGDPILHRGVWTHGFHRQSRVQ